MRRQPGEETEWWSQSVYDNEFTLLKWPPQSSDLNPIQHLWDVMERESASWMSSRQICSNCIMRSYQYGPKSLRNISNTLLNICNVELMQFWRKKGVQPGTSKVYLIKWPKGQENVLSCALLKNTWTNAGNHKQIYLIINSCIRTKKYSN